MDENKYNYKPSVHEKVCINEDKMSQNEIKQAQHVGNISTIFHFYIKKFLKLNDYSQNLK